MSLDINYVRKQPFIGSGRIITPVITETEHFTNIDRRDQVIVWSPNVQQELNRIKDFYQKNS